MTLFVPIYFRGSRGFNSPQPSQTTTQFLQNAYDSDYSSSTFQQPHNVRRPIMLSVAQSSSAHGGMRIIRPESSSSSSTHQHQLLPDAEEEEVLGESADVVEEDPLGEVEDDLIHHDGNNPDHPEPGLMVDEPHPPSSPPPPSLLPSPTLMAPTRHVTVIRAGSMKDLIKTEPRFL